MAIDCWHNFVIKSWPCFALCITIRRNNMQWNATTVLLELQSTGSPVWGKIRIHTLCFIRNIYKERFSRLVKFFKNLRNGLVISQKNKERNAVTLNFLRNAWLVIEIFEDDNTTCIVKCSLFFWWLLMNLEKCKKFIKYVLIIKDGIIFYFNHFQFLSIWNKERLWFFERMLRNKIKERLSKFQKPQLVEI